MESDSVYACLLFIKIQLLTLVYLVVKDALNAHLVEVLNHV